MTTAIESIHSQLQEFLQARKNFYELLHLLFLEPKNGDLFMVLSNSTDYFQELGEVYEGGKILQQFFSHLTGEQIKQEKVEYQRLFVGPGPLGAPPWESYYRSKENLLFEECMYQIRKEYHRFGLKFIYENNEPDDHLLLELEFMATLIEKSVNEENFEVLVDLLSSQIYFLQNHLSIWIPYFCARLIEHTTSQLYLGAAMLLEDFISFDLESLLELRERLDYAGK